MEPVSVGGLGGDQIDFSRHIQGFQDIAALGADVARQGPQDALHLSPLFQQVFLDIVVEVHHRHRLDKKCRSAGGLVMHDAREIEAVFLLDGDDIPVLPHRYESILEIFLVIGIVEEIRQFVFDTVFRHQDSCAQARQLDRCRILDVPFFVKDTGQLLGKACEICQIFRIGCEDRSIFPFFEKEVLQILHARNGLVDGLEFFRVEDTSHPGPLDAGRNIRDAAQGDPLAFIKDAQSLGGLFLHPFDDFKLRGTLEFQGELLPQGGPGLPGEPALDLVEFQCIDSKFCHITKHL